MHVWVLRAIVRCLMTVNMDLKVPNTDHDAESEQPRPSQGATQKYGNGMSMSHVLDTGLRLLIHLLIRTVGSGSLYFVVFYYCYRYEGFDISFYLRIASIARPCGVASI